MLVVYPVVSAMRSRSNTTWVNRFSGFPMGVPFLDRKCHLQSEDWSQDS